ncbi:hypothetical protein [Actinacidiphila glaucinigra]|uniref:hypothetical protein n=1 Tax=Actinacidiphila glaucinigra TaxID=235986 RepID=UPI003710B0D4
MSAEPSDDWQDYFNEAEIPRPYWPSGEADVWLWRRVRAFKRMRAARRAWAAENGRAG